MATGKCPQCGSRLKIDDPKKTPLFRCPSCGHVCRVGPGEPAAGGEPAPGRPQTPSAPADAPANSDLAPAPWLEEDLPTAPASTGTFSFDLEDLAADGLVPITSDAPAAPAPEPRTTPVPEHPPAPVPEPKTAPIPEPKTAPLPGTRTAPLPVARAGSARGTKTAPDPGRGQGGGREAAIALIACVVTLAVAYGVYRFLDTPASPDKTKTARPGDPSAGLGPEDPAGGDTGVTPPATVPPGPAAPTTTPPPGQPTPAAPGPAITPLSPKELFDRVSPAIVRVVVRDRQFRTIGQGAGLVVSEDGLIVTNHFTAAKACFAHVATRDGRVLFAEGLAGTDPAWDLALLKVNARQLPHVALAGGPPPPLGTRVFGIGNAIDPLLAGGFRDGLIGGPRRLPGELAAILTSIPTEKDSSGGPVLTVDGKVVGITSYHLGIGQEVSFAIPAGKALELIARQENLQRLASAGLPPDNKAVLTDLDRAWSAIEKRDWPAAGAALADLKKSGHGANAFVCATAGYLHSQQGQWDAARKAYRDAVDAWPESPELQRDLGAACEQLGLRGEAITAYERTAALDGGDAQLHWKLAGLYEAEKRPGDVIASCEAVIRLDPTGSLGRQARKLRDATLATQKSASWDTLKQNSPALARDDATIRSRLAAQCPDLDLNVPFDVAMAYCAVILGVDIEVDWRVVLPLGLHYKSHIMTRFQAKTWGDILQGILDAHTPGRFLYTVENGKVFITARPPARGMPPAP